MLLRLHTIVSAAISRYAMPPPLSRAEICLLILCALITFFSQVIIHHAFATFVIN